MARKSKSRKSFSRPSDHLLLTSSVRSVISITQQVFYDLSIEITILEKIEKSKKKTFFERNFSTDQTEKGERELKRSEERRKERKRTVGDRDFLRF